MCGPAVFFTKFDLQKHLEMVLQYFYTKFDRQKHCESGRIPLNQYLFKNVYKTC